MLSLSDLAEIVARHFWRMALVGLVCAGAAAYALLTAAPTFEARTLLLYKLGRDYLYVPEPTDVGTGVRAPDPGDLQQIVGAEMQIIVNRELMRSLAEAVGVERIAPDAVGDPAAADIAGDTLRGMISATLIPNTLMVDVRVRHGDPVFAAEIANKLVSLYLDRRAKVFSQRDAAYLSDRLGSVRAALAETEAEVRVLLDGRDPLTFETEQGILVARQAALETQISEAEAQETGLTVRRAALDRERAAQPETVVEYRQLDRNPILAATEARILALEAERTAAAASLGDGHPAALALDRQIAALRTAVEGQPAQIEVASRVAVNPVRRETERALAEVDAALAEVAARREHLRGELARNAEALARAAALAPSLAALQSSIALQRTQVAQLDAQLRESRLADVDSPGGSVRLLERAEPPRLPVGPPTKIRLLFALVAGAIAAAATGLLAHLARPAVLTADMLERRLGAPVLAEIGRTAVRRPIPRPAG